MNPISLKPRDAFSPLQVAGTIRGAFVAVVDPSPNVVDQIIKSGSPKPHATVSNPMVAAVDSYTPPPGRNLTHYLTMDVDKAGQENTTVADALQRYLNVSPTRKPGGDPKDIASNDSFPTLILQEDSAWDEAMPYEFSVNGVQEHQSQPTFYVQGGHLRVRLIGRGVATVSTPATEPQPYLQAGPQAAGAYYPSAVAAQMAMRRMTDMLDPAGEFQTQPAGPDVNRDVNETLTEVAETLSPMNARDFGPKISASVRAGMNKFANMGIYRSSPQLSLTSMAGRV
ncbi:MAG: hypothetical protein LBP95_05930 [Deltaproteobacteria bacterium]|jgi:hypothetical protein|nr:hypothetical protein [Deltaproteobacteria bacterium]